MIIALHGRISNGMKYAREERKAVHGRQMKQRKQEGKRSYIMMMQKNVREVREKQTDQERKGTKSKRLVKEIY